MQHEGAQFSFKVQIYMVFVVWSEFFTFSD